MDCRFLLIVCHSPAIVFPQPLDGVFSPSLIDFEVEKLRVRVALMDVGYSRSPSLPCSFYGSEAEDFIFEGCSQACFLGGEVSMLLGHIQSLNDIECHVEL